MSLEVSVGNVTWVVSKISGAAGALGAGTTKIINWLLCFRCTSEEFRVLVADGIRREWRWRRGRGMMRSRRMGALQDSPIMTGGRMRQWWEL